MVNKKKDVEVQEAIYRGRMIFKRSCVVKKILPLLQKGHTTVTYVIFRIRD